MKAIAVFLLFVGMFLVVQGYYQRKEACPTPKTEVKYIPLTLYEEQLAEKGQSVQKQFKSLFEDTTPWPTIRG